MRSALQANIAAQRLGAAGPVFVPAPLGGWNTRDSLAQMSPTDAPLLDNWFPRATEVVQRGGSADWATGLAKPVKSLVAYTPKTGTNKLYAVTDDGVYDATTAGAVGAAEQALTNGYVNGFTMTNSAGTSFLWLANGVDAPVMFDGASWSAPSITGITTTSIVAPFFYKHRVWFIEKLTMNLYYMPLDSIQGAASKVPLGNIFRNGGYLVAGAGWSFSPYGGNMGEGSSEMLVVISSEGQLALYQGNDPTSAATWGLVGVWYVGKPVGNRCFVELAGDLGVVTENGLFPLSMLLRSGVVNFSTAMSRKIQPTFVSLTSAVSSGAPATVQGFDATVYPAFDALIVNTIPASGETQHQLVMNTLTGAWCSFSNWPALCFRVFQGQLYFGTASGTVRQAWDLLGNYTSDVSSDIVTNVQTAYNKFGIETLKNVELFRLLLAYSGSVDTRWAISPDFATVHLSSFIPRTASTAGSAWETSSWDTSDWAPPVLRYKVWRAAAHIPGFALSLWLQTAQNSGSLSWAGTDYILERGNML